MIVGMGLLSEIRDHYSTLDHSLKKKERHVLSRAADIIVPKKDRKNVKDLADFVDRFAGMIASDAPNTDVAPRMSSIAVEPFVTAKKKPSPYNLYAAAMAPFGLFPWGRRHEDLPTEWKAKIGGTIRNTGSDDYPHYQYVPPGSDRPHADVRNDVAMYPDQSHISFLEHTAPGISHEVIHDLMAPLNNRFQEHGIPIDAGPINVKVAGSILLGNLRGEPGAPKRYTDASVRASLSLLRRNLDSFNAVLEMKDTQPERAAMHAQGIRDTMQRNHSSKRGFLNSLRAFETFMKHPEGGDEPDFEIPVEAKGVEGKHWMDLIGNPGEWQARTSGIVVPQRPRLETNPDVHGALFAHEHTAASHHTAEEWNRMSHMDRINAAERVRDGLPARWADYQELRNETRREYEATRRPGDFSFLSGTEQQNAMQAHAQGIQPEETLHDLGLIEPADLSLGQNTRPSLTEITRTAQDVQGHSPSGTFVDFVASTNEATRQARAGVGEEEWGRMSSEERGDLVRAQVAQNRRSAEHSRAQSRMQALADRADELHRSGIELDITERAVLAASRNPEWNLMSEQERQAEARRERRRIAHESER